jgi:hypothetical protein
MRPGIVLLGLADLWGRGAEEECVRGCLAYLVVHSTVRQAKAASVAPARLALGPLRATWTRVRRIP